MRSAFHSISYRITVQGQKLEKKEQKADYLIVFYALPRAFIQENNENYSLERLLFIIKLRKGNE